MLDLQRLQLLPGYKNQGNHRQRHIRVARDQLLDVLCVQGEQLTLPLIQVLRDRFRYEYACRYLAMGNEKPAK
jgi:hypothetical protein